MSLIPWTFTGKVLGRAILNELVATGSSNNTFPLESVTITVYTRACISGDVWGTWLDAGTTTTNAAGEFTFTANRDLGKKQAYFTVKLANTRLKVYSSVAGESETIDARTNGFDPTKVELNPAANATSFRVAFGTITLGPTEVIANAILADEKTLRTSSTSTEAKRINAYAVYMKMINFISTSFTNGWPSDVLVHVNYPANNLFVGDQRETPYASPIEVKIGSGPKVFTLNIVKNTTSDWYKIDTIMHEFMHIWFFNQVSGEDMLTFHVFGKDSTHSEIEGSSYVSFHEAIAEFMAGMMHKNLFANSKGVANVGKFDFFNNEQVFNGKAVWASPPVARGRLLLSCIDNMDKVSHSEKGYISLFSILTCPHLIFYDLNNAIIGTKRNTAKYTLPKTVPIGKTKLFEEMTIRDLAKTFEPSTARGIPVLHNKDLNLESYLKRIQLLFPEFTDAILNKIKILLDPNETRNPVNLL